MKFKLEITLGNDAMQTPEDVAEALSRVVVSLRSENVFDSDSVGYIYDLNGNTVGRWHVTRVRRCR